MKLFKNRYEEVIAKECRSHYYVYQKVDVYKIYYIQGLPFQFRRFEMKEIKYYSIRTSAIGNAMYGSGGFTLYDAYRAIIRRTKKKLEKKNA